MGRCAACNSTILMGGESLYRWQFCDDACRESFKIALADELVEPALIKQQVDEVFNGPCPICQKPGPLDCYSATKITGMLVMFSMNSERRICCAHCGRMGRLSAFVHCLFLGWWSPKAAICNIFVLPTNLIAIPFVRTPRQPSADLIGMVKASMGERMAARVASQQARGASGEAATA
jgi:hypothetical protein